MSLPPALLVFCLSLSLSSLVFFLHLCPYPCVTLTEASETLHSDLENQRMSGSVEKASIFGAWVVARTYICVANITPCSNPLCARAGTDAVVHALYAMLCRAVVQRGTSNSADACAANNSWATKKASRYAGLQGVGCADEGSCCWEVGLGVIGSADGCAQDGRTQNCWEPVALVSSSSDWEPAGAGANNAFL